MEKDLITAFSQCDASRGLVYGTFVTLIFVFILYIPKKNLFLIMNL